MKAWDKSQGRAGTSRDVIYTHKESWTLTTEMEAQTPSL